MGRDIRTVNITPVDPADDEELYESHGDHNDAIMDTEKLLKEYIADILQKSKVYKTGQLDVKLDDRIVKASTVASLQYGYKDLNILALIASDTEKGANQFVSLFPHMVGTPYKVKIDKVLEWDNRMEATIRFTIGDRSFACFAADYFSNKEKYAVGKEVYLSLAAIGMTVHEGMRGFDFEGQQVVDFLAKTGETPDYDEQGNIKPLHFNMESMVAYFATNKKAPDEAEFQSPATEIYHFHFLDIPFVKSNILIDDDDTHTEIPLYFREEFLPNIKECTPVGGWLWLTGEIAEETTYLADETVPYGVRLRVFEDAMRRKYFDSFRNLEYVATLLPHIKIREGYILDGFRQGDTSGSVIRLYVRQRHATKRWIPYPNVCEKPSFLERIGINRQKKSVPQPYDDSMYIHDLHSYNDTKHIPPILPYFTIPFTECGITEAWLLTIAPDFMPKTWHAGYGDVEYICDKEKFEKLFAGTDNSDTDFIIATNEAKKIPLDELLPHVKIDGNRASLTYSYWNAWKGLVRETTIVIPKGESVEFSEPQREVLVPYSCDIIF